jgi:hypothetical protein
MQERQIPVVNQVQAVKMIVDFLARNIAPSSLSGLLPEGIHITGRAGAPENPDKSGSSVRPDGPPPTLRRETE